MPIIPEKLASRQDVKSAIACQFWEQPSHSTRSIDGQVWSLPCEPPALNLAGSSGLSRTQQLIATQALGVPAFPSYDANGQGLVLDRVLARLGGKRWWTAIGGRVKAQRLWSRGVGVKGKMQSLRDLDNYGLVARGRYQLARRLTLNGMVESTSVTLLHRHLHRRTAGALTALRHRLRHQGPAAEDQHSRSDTLEASQGSVTSSSLVGGHLDASGSSFAFPAIIEDGPSLSVAASHQEINPSSSAGKSGSPASPLSSRGGSRTPLSRTGGQQGREGEGEELFRAHSTLRYALPGHDLTATVGYHQDYVDSNGEYAHVPLAASLDLASQYRQDGLQYRVGLHQVTAPAIEGAKAAAHRTRTTLHIQGAVAVEGEAYVWKPPAPSSNDGQTSTAVAAAGPTTMTSPASAAPNGSQVPAAASAAVAASPSQAMADQVTPSVAAPAGTASVLEGTLSTRDASAVDDGEACRHGPPLPLQEPHGDGAAAVKKESRVASALASAVKADAEPDPSTFPPTRLRLRRKKKKAGKEAGGGEGDEEQEHEQHEQRDGDGNHDHDHHRHHNHDHMDGIPQPDSPDADGSNAARALSNAAGAEEGGEASEAPRVSPAPAEGWQHPTALDSFIKPLEDLLHTVTHVAEGAIGAVQEASSSPAAPPPGSQQAQGTVQGVHVMHSSLLPARAEQLLNVSAQTIQAGIQESLALLEQVKECVARLTSEVQEGSLQRMSQQLADTRKEAPRRRPYSVFLSQPHLKLNGSMGCLARMPLPPLSRSTSLGTSAPPGGSSTSLNSLGSSIAQTWEPYLKGTSLRLFASGGISGQLGRFTRPFLDYTAVALRADVGLTSPHVVGLLPDPSTMDASDAHRPDKHRAFALEGRGSWHSLSASLAQQVFGPVRARADFRFALDPTNMPQNAGERSTIKGLVQTALSVRPSLLEAVFGFDVVLPGTEGAARLACWWSPHRKEAMAELRLF